MKLQFRRILALLWDLSVVWSGYYLYDLLKMKDTWMQMPLIISAVVILLVGDVLISGVFND